VASSKKSSVFAGFRFPREVISVAVRWYLRYGLSYRDVEELLAERGITVDHVTVYRWVQRFTPEFVEAARFSRHAPGDRWFADETYIKVAGRWTYLYRAIDQHGQVIDVMLSERRDLAAARRFFTRALHAVKWELRAHPGWSGAELAQAAGVPRALAGEVVTAGRWHHGREHPALSAPEPVPAGHRPAMASRPQTACSAPRRACEGGLPGNADRAYRS
jgi:DDE domain